jgi:hypothetical protein
VKSSRRETRRERSSQVSSSRRSAPPALRISSTVVDVMTDRA